PTLGKVGKIHSLDCEAGILEVKRGNRAKGVWPIDGSLIPEATVPNAVLVAAVRRVAMAWAGMNEDEWLHGEFDEVAGVSTWSCGLSDGPQYRALLDLLERQKPRLHGWEGGALVQPDESLIEAATSRCLAMDQTTLFIQGPPG